MLQKMLYRLCLLYVLIANVTASQKWCQDQVQSILTDKKWGEVNIDEVHRIQADMNNYLTNNGISKIEGHSGNGDTIIERMVYYSISSLTPCFRRICEIGFNAGHSTIEWLVANPGADIVTFDLFTHAYSNLSESFIRSHPSLNATPRFELYKGDSTIIVPEYANSHKGVLCDLLSIDGGHSFELASLDIKNMKQLANPEFHVVFIDDTNCGFPHCVDRAMNDMIEKSVLARVENGSFTFGYRNTRGLTVLKYL